MDLALWLMGYPKPVSILAATHDHLGREQAREKNCTFDVEDLGAAMIRFENGASLQLEASWDGFELTDNEWGTRLLGTKAGCALKRDEGYVISKKSGEMTTQKIEEPYPGPPSAARHLADAILSGEPHLCTGEEGLALMRILDGIYASAESGREFRFDQTEQSCEGALV